MIAKVSRALPAETIDVPVPSALPEPVAGPTPLLQVLWRRRWTVLITTLACLGGGVLYLLKATPVYTSASRLLVEQTGPKILSEVERSVRSSNYLATQAQVITSTPIVSAALEKSDASQMRTFSDVDNPLAYLKKALKADVGKKDDVITVSLDSPYPEEAADLVNRVVEEYVAYTSGQKRSTSAEILKILNTEKAARDEELAGHVKAMLEFKKQNGALSFSNDKGNIILGRLASLSEAMTQVQLETIKARAEHEAVKAVLKSREAMRAYVEANQSKGIESMDKEYGELRAELNKQLLVLATLGSAAGEAHRQVGAVRANIAMIDEQIADKERRMVEARVADAAQATKAAEDRQRDIRSAFDAQQEEALALNSKEAEYLRLRSNVERTEKMVDLVDARIKELNVNEDTGALNTQVLEVARPEDKPTKPRRPLVLAAALMLGLMLGAGLGLTRDWMDHRLRSAEDIMASLGLPVLGVVPHMPAGQSIVSRGQSVSLEPMSEAAESYRTVRTALFFGAAGADAKTILVTSPAPGDGKSTSASNIAIAMAQAGHRTLLLDADCRKPTQHRIFELDDKLGLSSVIAGQCPLRDAIQRTAVARLQVLPCGPIPQNPAEILNGKRFAQVMDALSRAYDRVVIDSPPVMPVTDARILAASADVTVLVLRANKSTHRLSTAARDGLASVGANILGVVVNDVSRRKGTYGGYGYGYYGTYGGANGGGPSRVIEGTVTEAHESIPAASLESRP